MEFLTQVLSVLLMLAILSSLIIVHECGHFLVARLFGFQTPVFGFGLPFGPYITVGKAFETEFRIHACLLGGYVAIPELGDESRQDMEAYGVAVLPASGMVEGEALSKEASGEHNETPHIVTTDAEIPIEAPHASSKDNPYGVELKPFRKFPIWQRALVAFAGVGFNIIFAYLIMVTMLLTIGEPVPETYAAGTFKSNPIALNAGILKGDKIVSLDKQPVKTSEEIISYFTSHKSTPVVIQIERNGKPMDISMTPNADGKVGMALDMKNAGYKRVDRPILEVLILSYQKVSDLTRMMLDALGKLPVGIVNQILHLGKPPAVGEPGIQDVHGILAVIYIGKDIAQQDWNQLFTFTILISMDLAILNLLPWPALDGGHLAFMAYEAIFRKPVGEKAHGEIVRWGFMSLLVLMAVIMVNDVTALVQGKLDIKKKDKDTQQQEVKKSPANQEQK
ncbi:MAG: M50 family metallopeptidase [Candidatus Melainabacteria bacterium]|nr:M50 family metallopeptidase [Candidatus Melainabacteria bacterium]